jgi:hypothetical protein
MFSVSTKSCRISTSFFPINTISSAYVDIFNCYLPIFVPLGNIFIIYITFCNAKLKNIGVECHPVTVHLLLYIKKFYFTSNVRKYWVSACNIESKLPEADRIGRCMQEPRNKDQFWLIAWARFFALLLNAVVRGKELIKKL